MALAVSVPLAGAGPTFCAGADLGWMMKAVAYTRQDNLRDAEDLARMLELLEPFCGHRGRGIRLLTLAGHHPPAFGPRRRILPMHRW